MPFLPSESGLARGLAATLAVAAGSAALAWPGIVRMDALSAVFLAASGLLATADLAPGAVLRLLAAALCVAAPDVRLAVLGFELLCLPSRPGLRFGLAGSVPMLGAAALLGGAFAGVRPEPPEAAVAVPVLLLALAGAGQRVGAPGIGAKLAGLYVLARMLELCGPGAPGWLGLVLLPCGAGLAAAAGWRAVAADTVEGVAGWLLQAGLGVALTALGAAAAARGSDLTDLAGAATSGMLLIVATQAAGYAVLAGTARAVRAGAGTTRLAALGGLAGAMPRTAACLALAAASLAFLPPMAGFAGVLPAVQAMLGLPRAGTPGVVVAVSAALAGVAAGCALAAVLRLLATACLGRPRTPRGSAAEDAPRQAALPAAAGLLAVAGVVLPPLVAVPQPFAAVLAALVLAALGVPACLLTRRRRTAEPWSDGRGPPPPWLPFGDPAEQWSAAAFAAPFRFPALRAVRRAVLARLPVAGRRSPPWREAALFGVLLAIFLLLAHA